MSVSVPRTGGSSWKVSCSVRTCSLAMNRRVVGSAGIPAGVFRADCHAGKDAGAPRFMESFVFRPDLLTGHEPASRWDRRHPCRRIACGLPRRQRCRRSQVHGKRTPPNLDVSWDYEPEMHKSFKIKRPILRFMESFVFLSDLLTGHEPSSRWDRRHPCRRIARGLPRRQGCRRSQVHGKA